MGVSTTHRWCEPPMATALGQTWTCGCGQVWHSDTTEAITQQFRQLPTRVPPGFGWTTHQPEPVGRENEREDG